MDIIEAFIPYLIIIAFIAFIPLLGISNAKMSGWTKLAEKYPCNEVSIGDTSSFSYMMVNNVQYNRTIDLGVNETHLYLKISFPMNFGAKPLLIPYTAIKGKQMGWDLINRVFLTIDGVEINMSIKDADRMVEASKGAWNYQKQPSK